MEKKSGLTFVFALLLALSGLSALGVASAIAAEAPEDVVVNFAGLQVAIDPETGRLRAPSAEEAAALAQGMRDLFASESLAATGGTVVTEHKDGMLSAVLGWDSLNFTVVRGNGDGTYSQECVSSPEEAEAFVSATPPSTDER